MNDAEGKGVVVKYDRHRSLSDMQVLPQLEEVISNLSGVIESSVWFDHTLMSPVSQVISRDFYEFNHDSGKMEFGCVSGPSYTNYLFYHDLAHALEWVTKGQFQRLHARNFALRYSQVEIMGNLFDEPTTSQATERELETLAIQKRLMEEDGCCESPEIWFEEQVRALEGFMVDWSMIPISFYRYTDNGRVTVSRDKISYEEIQSYRLRWAQELFMFHYRNYVSDTLLQSYLKLRDYLSKEALEPEGAVTGP